MGRLPEHLALFERFIDGFSLDEWCTKLWSASPKPSVGPGAHFHEYWELRLVLAGRMDWPGGLAADHPPCLLLPPGEVHLACRPGPRSRSPVMLVLCDNGAWQFSENWVHRSGGVAGRPIERRLGQPVGALLERLGRERDQLTQPAVRAFWEAALRAVFLAFRVAMERPDDAAPRSASSLIERARGYILTQAHRPELTVEQVARICGCTPTHLAHVFRRELGHTVRQHIIEIRLQRASEILRTGGYLVKEVAYLTGWRSEHHFSNSFFKRFGKRPSELAGASG